MTRTEFYKNSLAKSKYYDEAEFDERAGQLEYDGNMSRSKAELEAFTELKNKYKRLYDEEQNENLKHTKGD